MRPRPGPIGVTVGGRHAALPAMHRGEGGPRGGNGGTAPWAISPTSVTDLSPSSGPFFGPAIPPIPARILHAHSLCDSPARRRCRAAFPDLQDANLEAPDQRDFAESNPCASSRNRARRDPRRGPACSRTPLVSPGPRRQMRTGRPPRAHGQGAVPALRRHRPAARTRVASPGRWPGHGDPGSYPESVRSTSVISRPAGRGGGPRLLIASSTCKTAVTLVAVRPPHRRSRLRP